MKKNIAVLFGGVSSEHEVSRRSVVSIIDNLNKDKYEIFPIGITKLGKWYWYCGNIENIPDGSWETDTANKKEAFISPDSSVHGMLVVNNGNCETINIDVVFPVLHGRNGEDGTVQGLFELAKLPYVGCGVLASSACMDKIFANIILTAAGVKKARFCFIYTYDFDKDPEKSLDHIEKSLGSYPVFVKPSNAGSSVGISKASSREELIKAIKIAAEHDHRILIEETIVGQEVECAVLGNSEPIASIIGEIAPANEFYDYEAKYVSDSNLYIPAHIDDETSALMQEIAKKAYLAMGCRGLSRVDFFVRESTKEILLNEINTLPGFTSISMYPKLFENSGIPTPELLDKLIDLALERFLKNEK
ncbi:MAG: D-alanine--D-alanine ligase [Eubacteriales bacterium SKADARSKE-1]|nr:D-alanine--D-alanine ligase [Eubacteriales bacterium SKADARSKE-1]